MSNSSSARTSRLRVLAFVVLLVGLIGAFIIGAVFQAQTVTPQGSLGGKVTNYLSVADSGDGSFNWLFALLVAGPALIAASVLYGASELTSAIRRTNRRSRGMGLDVGDEV
ncbi:MAG: hypothetical protein ACXVJX_02470 [Acidimicrobiia bacterium]